MSLEEPFFLEDASLSNRSSPDDDSLDPDPQDYIDLLLEAKGNATVSMWTRLACEYCKTGLYDSAEKVLESAVSRKWFFVLGRLKDPVLI